MLVHLDLLAHDLAGQVLDLVETVRPEPGCTTHFIMIIEGTISPDM